MGCEWRKRTGREISGIVIENIQNVKRVIEYDEL